MLTLASSGSFFAVLKSQRGNIIGSIVTFYLMITTAWLAGRRRNTGKNNRDARFAMRLSLIVGVLMLVGTVAAAIFSVDRRIRLSDPMARAAFALRWGSSA